MATTPMMQQRIEILGVPVDAVTMKDALTVVDDIIASNGQTSIVAINPEKVIRAQNDRNLLQFLRRSALLIPDGIGIVVAARLLGLGRLVRVPGSELMPAICNLAATKGYPVFLFGGTPRVNERACEVLRLGYPELKIAGRHHGFVNGNQMSQVIDQINRSNASILFVALGTPKQERWISEFLSHLNIRVCQGVGGTFDVIAGEVKRAPLVFRRLHLEWFYRLMSQPARLHRQTALPKFALQVLRKCLTQRIRSNEFKTTRN